MVARIQILLIPDIGTNALYAVVNQKKLLKNTDGMDNLNKYRSQVAYKRLEDGPIDDIDAALFTGDMFMLEENRIALREVMDRWESRLIQLEQIQNDS